MNHDYHIEWDCVPAANWDAALATAPYAAYQQHYAYGEALAAIGRQLARGAIMRDGAMVALVQCVARRLWRGLHVGTATRGPVWLQPFSDAEKFACYRALKAARPFGRFSPLLITPEGGDAHEALTHASYRRVFTGHSTILMDLTLNEDMLLANMDGKWRNRLRAAESSGIRVAQIGKKLTQYSWLLAKEAVQASQIGYKALPADFTARYQAHAGKGALFALRAEHQGETIAAVLSLLHGASATYHIGWSNDDGKKLGAHNLLLWEMIKALKQQHVTILDLGGISTEPESAGLARFKLGLCKQVVTLPGTYL